MSARRFKLEIDGCMFFCAAFESERDLDALLAGRLAISSGVNLSSAPGPAGLDWPPRIKPERPVGRPSFDSVLADAVQALQLDPAQSLAERTRRVLRHLAETCEASEIPGTRTVERYLAEQQPVRQKSRQKSRQKPLSAKLATTGG